MDKKGSYIVNLICTNCKKEFSAEELHNVCQACGKVLYPIYNLEKAKESLTKKEIKSRSIFSIWRLHEIMPVVNPQYRYSLGEGWTPIVPLRNLGYDIELKYLYIKDEGQNPTSTFKSRGLCAAVSKAVELGVKDFVLPSAGNAGAALSAYAAHTASNAFIFVPENTPELIMKEIEYMGGKLTRVPGLITDAGMHANKAIEKYGYFDVSTLKEPYRVEGKKTMGFELAEQFNWELPDHIIYPTGGGTGIVGMWKAFNELETLDLITDKRPRMISVQSSGCAPIVEAFKKGTKWTNPWKNAETFAAGLCIPHAIGDYLILRAIRESNGTAIAVDDSEIKKSMYKLAKMEGIMLSPEAAATITAVEELTKSGFIKYDEKILLFGTGSGLTTPNEW